MHEFEEDAVASLEGSIFEPKTPFLYQGVMHNPAQEGSGVNHGYQHGADKIEVPHEMVMAEIEMGVHDVTGRPISALLNHCVVFKASSESRPFLVEFYSRVKKRKSARKRVRIETKKKSEQTRTVVEDEKFGTEGMQATPDAPVKKRAKRKTRKKSKAKKVVTPATVTA